MTRAEVKSVLSRLHGIPKLVATLLYGTGMRLMECLRLRVKDVGFGRNQITVREGKGDRDRRVPLPAVIRQELATWLSQVKRTHSGDIAEGFGSVYLPYALNPRRLRMSPAVLAAGSFNPGCRLASHRISLRAPQ